jgi:hypothetical protein
LMTTKFTPQTTIIKRARARSRGRMVGYS